jgi:hypothetical protein
MCCVTITGCGATQQRAGTEQLLLSDAVDRSVDRIDLKVLRGQTVFLDSSYIEPVKTNGYVTSSYIISALRQKLITSGCLLQAMPDDADYIVEARVGALGTDAVEVTYGIPASNAIGAAASLITTAPVAPAIPEISFGKRNGTLSTSKVVAFAYHRESGEPVWQSGAAVAKSDAKDSWLFGAGPWQNGSIYDGTQFAGSKLRFPRFGKKPSKPPAELQIADSHQFIRPDVLKKKLEIAAETAAADNIAAQEAAAADKEVVPAGHEVTSDAAAE